MIKWEAFASYILAIAAIAYKCSDMLFISTANKGHYMS